MDNSAKILLLGRTGVGKSAFINYFLGKKVAESAAGKPVTPEYFIPYEIEDGRYPVKIFDTKGLETLNANKQLDEIIDGIKKRNNSDDIFNWFHTIFYCVSMSNKFDNIEADFIGRLQKNLTQHIHIILTHCDICGAETIRRMRERIISQLGSQDNIEIFEVVCVSKKKRNGEVVQPRGREIISERVFDLLLEDIAYKISGQYAISLRAAMISGADFTLSKFEKLIDSVVKLKTLMDYIQDENKAQERIDGYLEQIEQDIENAISNTNRRFGQILQPVAKLYASYRGIVTGLAVEDVQLDFESFVDFDALFDEKQFFRSLFPKMFKKGYVDAEGDLVEPESFIELVKMMGTGLGELFSIKKNLKKFCREVHMEFVSSIPSEAELQQKAHDKIVEFIEPYRDQHYQLG